MKILLVALIITISFSQLAFADAKTKLEMVNSPNAEELFMKEQQETAHEQADNTANEDFSENNSLEIEPNFIPTQNEMTNYQYDEENYHYYKLNNFIQDNLDYSQTSKNRY